ncbi:MarR family transcriptional regulator [Aneurinibacillus sp. Ricciae_BoGa-3]|uniref:MarR family winged helix-turn-helix transcriptional regulator n=1 Tax=Aneurinibacillus sp. Ricciae_BoGa-3 TaxID=3022697 RepID=UPI0023423CD3|nr:MarR family transcriptional regulator [Aneurinibacillus sp. Ricciae_BoGa-3]WCK52669.1 MarR family transcriptional regulator [Aneurinibacillus sp. Ricciae_BoGa-3]
MDREAQIIELDKSSAKISRYINRFLSCEEELNPQQFFLLRSLHDKGHCTVSELAKDILLSPSATTISVNKLVKKGLINRIRDEKDRRLVWIDLSNKGVQLLESVIKARNAMLQQLLSNLDNEDIEQLIHITRKMIAKLD